MLSKELLKATAAAGEYILDACVDTLAKNNNCTVYRPELDEVLLDIDGDRSLYEERLEFLQRILPDSILGTKELKSRNGNLHVILQFDRELSDAERLLLQVILGSDINREILNTGRLFGHGDSQNCLLRPVE